MLFMGIMLHHFLSGTLAANIFSLALKGVPFATIY
jgi:hypothetical protein